jgi:hypothetical protein
VAAAPSFVSHFRQVPVSGIYPFLASSSSIFVLDCAAEKAPGQRCKSSPAGDTLTLTSELCSQLVQVISAEIIFQAK